MFGMVDVVKLFVDLREKGLIISIGVINMSMEVFV